MKKSIVIFLVLSMLLTGCENNSVDTQTAIGKEVQWEDFVRQHEPLKLAEIYYLHGNFINSPEFPPVIKPFEVYENMGKYLIVDLRSPEAYESGHINGAYNVPKDKVLDFLKNKQKASAYDKVVFVCYSGQTASYVTGITRFSGFDNTYALLFGMAGWNKDFSAPLMKGFGDRYPEIIEKGTYGEGIEKNEEFKFLQNPDLKKLPELPDLPPGILISNQADSNLKLKRPEFLLKIDEFAPWLKTNPDNLYPVFYIDKKKFYEAHVKGSAQFTPRKDLSLDARLTDLPLNKNIVLYCKTGHTGGNAAAYLRMLGYDAKNLIFGAGSFMYSLWKEKGWMPDLNIWINEFPYIEGKQRLSVKLNSLPKTPVKKKTPQIQVPKRKKKEVSGGCG